MQTQQATPATDTLLPQNTTKRSCQTDRTNPINNLFLSEQQQLRTDAIRLAKTSRRNSRKALQMKTPSELIKDNILRIRQNRRINSLKQLTQQNVKLYYRIQAKQSEYKFDELHKDSICQLSRAQSRVNIGNRGESQTGDGLTRCQSAMSSIRVRCSSAQRSIASSKITLQPSLQVDRQTPSHLLSKISLAYDKENRQQNLEEKEQTIKKIVMDKETANRLLSKKMGLKIPMEDVKMFKSKTILQEKQIKPNTEQITLNIKEQVGTKAHRQLVPRGILTQRHYNLNHL